MERNSSIDLLKGFAILLVVMGHTMLEGDLSTDSSTLMFRILWTLQMPLFFLISGYVNRYSRMQPDNLVNLMKLINKRSRSYLMPFFVWKFVISGVFLMSFDVLDIKYLTNNKELGGYWFLLSLWTIVMIFLLANYLGIRTVKQEGIKRALAISSYFIGGYCLLALFGYFVGIGYFALKYTLYYLPFYLIGYLFGSIETNKVLINNEIITSLIGIISVVYFFLMLNFNFYTADDDSAMYISLRYIASLTGCAVTSYLFSKWKDKFRRLRLIFNWLGINSLEIYIIHFFFLGTININSDLSILELSGFLIEIINYVLCLLTTVAVILFIKNIPLLDKYLFYRF